MSHTARLHHYFATAKTLVVPFLFDQQIIRSAKTFPVAKTLVAIGWDNNATTYYLNRTRFPNVKLVMLNNCALDWDHDNQFCKYCISEESKRHMLAERGPFSEHDRNVRFEKMSHVSPHTMIELPGLPGHYDAYYVKREFVNYCNAEDIRKVGV